jgi:hypothetical protein
VNSVPELQLTISSCHIAALLLPRTSEARTVDSLRTIFGRTWTLTCRLGASSILRPPLLMQIKNYLGSVNLLFSLKCTIGVLESLLSYVVCPRTAYFGHFATVCEANRIIHIMYTESPINLKFCVYWFYTILLE